MLLHGVNSELLVIKKRTDDPTVFRVPLQVRIQNYIWNKLSKFILIFQKSPDQAFRSLNIFPTSISEAINKSDADIVQLHWVGLNTIGISDFKKIKKPIVWKLPDMWAFCGSEHYTFHENRYIDGYTSSNRPLDDRGIDFDKFVWRQKQKHWNNINLTIVCPSKWLTNCAKSSYLFKNYAVYNIPNPINLDLYKPPHEINSGRNYFNLPLEKKLILFVSSQKASDPRKGFDYLDGCIRELVKCFSPSSLRIVVIGIKTTQKDIHGVQLINLGYIWDEEELPLAYSAADVYLCPSNADNLPNTVKEAMACGTPCVAFDVGGVKEMVLHKRNGYLAPVGDGLELANGIKWILSQDKAKLSAEARKSAYIFHDPKSRVRDYLNVYNRILDLKK